MMNKINKLISICEMSQENLLNYLSNKLLKYYKSRNIKTTENYIYVKGSLPICLVSHLDTVHKTDPVDFYYDVKRKELFSPTGIGGDDRCGVYIILELLERNLRPSIIFCCDEEIGCVGASAFTKDYKTINNINWFLEFDRRGRNDVVAYDDNNEELTKVFESFGFKNNFGSFSDISELAPAYGISAVNISSGYYNAHTTKEYIKMDDLEWIIDISEKILKSKYVNNKYEYIEIKYNYHDYYTYKYDDFEEDVCSLCGKEFTSFDVGKQSEFGLVCDDCIRTYELSYCDECEQYVWKDEEGKCDVCENLINGDKYDC